MIQPIYCMLIRSGWKRWVVDRSIDGSINPPSIDLTNHSPSFYVSQSVSRPVKPGFISDSSTRALKANQLISPPAAVELVVQEHLWNWGLRADLRCKHEQEEHANRAAFSSWVSYVWVKRALTTNLYACVCCLWMRLCSGYKPKNNRLGNNQLQA